MKRLIIGYFAASIVALLVSDWLLTTRPYAALGFLIWIASGPIGVLGFATFGPMDTAWAVKNALYYLAATVGLAACLWFMHRKSGLRRRIGKVAIVLIWLICSSYVMEFLSWAA